MKLRGMNVVVTDENGEVEFANNITDKITIIGRGTVNITMTDLETIYNVFKKHFEEIEIKKN